MVVTGFLCCGCSRLCQIVPGCARLFQVVPGCTTMCYHVFVHVSVTLCHVAFNCRLGFRGACDWLEIPANQRTHGRGTNAP